MTNSSDIVRDVTIDVTDNVYKISINNGKIELDFNKNPRRRFHLAFIALIADQQERTNDLPVPISKVSEELMALARSILNDDNIELEKLYSRIYRTWYNRLKPVVFEEKESDLAYSLTLNDVKDKFRESYKNFICSFFKNESAGKAASYRLVSPCRLKIIGLNNLLNLSQCNTEMTCVENAVTAERYYKYIQARLRQAEQGATYSSLKELDSFEIVDHKLYCGREDDLNRVEDLINTGERMLAISGQSGIGESSFLQAALEPSLLKRKILPIFIRSYYKPVALSLRAELFRIFGERNLFDGANDIKDAAYMLPTICEEKVILVLDQFEKVFLHEELNYPHSLIEELFDWHQSKVQGMQIIISVRDSFRHLIDRWASDYPEIPIFQMLPLKSESAVRAVKHMLEIIKPRKISNKLIVHIVDKMRTNSAGHKSERVQPIELQLMFQQLLSKRIYDIAAYQNTYASIDQLLEEYIGSKLRPLNQTQIVLLQNLISPCANDSAAFTAEELSLEELCDRLPTMCKSKEQLADVPKLLRELENRRLIKSRTDDCEMRFSLRHEYLIPILQKTFSFDEIAQEISIINRHLEERLNNYESGKPFPEASRDILIKANEHLNAFSFSDENKWQFLLAGALRHNYAVDAFADCIMGYENHAGDIDLAGGGNDKRDSILETGQLIREVVWHYVAENENDPNVRSRAYELLARYSNVDVLERLQTIIIENREANCSVRLSIARALHAASSTIERGRVAMLMSLLAVKEKNLPIKKQMIELIMSIPNGIQHLFSLTCKGAPGAIKTLAVARVMDIYKGNAIPLRRYNTLSQGIKWSIKRHECAHIWHDQKAVFLLALITAALCCSLATALAGLIRGSFEGSVAWRVLARQEYWHQVYITAIGSCVGGFIYGGIYHLVTQSLRMLSFQRPLIHYVGGGAIAGALASFIIHLTTFSHLSGRVDVEVSRNTISRVYATFGILWGCGLGVGALIAVKNSLSGKHKMLLQIAGGVSFSVIGIILCIGIGELFIKEVVGESILFAGGAVGLSYGYFIAERIIRYEAWNSVFQHWQ